MVETLIYESPLTEEEPACSSSSNSSTGWKTSNKLRPLALTNSSTTELPEETDPLLTRCVTWTRFLCVCVLDGG